MKNTKIIYSSVVEQAAQAVEFLKIRAEQNLPIATGRQVQEAQRILAQRGGFTPLEVEMLALNVPMTRVERRAYEQSDEAIEQGFKYKNTTIKGRGDNLQTEVPKEMVEEMVTNANCKKHSDVVVFACNMFNYPAHQIEKITARVGRWAQSYSPRMPEHIRQKALLLSVIATGCQMEGMEVG